MQTIKLLIIDEHTAVRDALRVRLGSSPNIEVVATADGVPNALVEMSQQAIDVVLLGLAGTSDRDLRRTINEVQTLAAQHVAVMVVTSYADDIEREVICQAGAVRYLLKDINSSQLILEIEAVAQETAAANGNHGSGQHNPWQNTTGIEPLLPN